MTTGVGSTPSTANARKLVFQSGSSNVLGSNFNTFLTLLTTQLQNQDPTSPLDTNQFTSQLVQFSQVEQAINTNTNLQALINSRRASNRSRRCRSSGRPSSTRTTKGRWSTAR